MTSSPLVPTSSDDPGPPSTVAGSPSQVGTAGGRSSAVTVQVFVSPAAMVPPQSAEKLVMT